METIFDYICPDYLNLRKYCYFSKLSDEALKVLSWRLVPLDVPAGTAIIQEGTPAGDFYLVRQGEVEVTKNAPGGDTASLSVLGEGKCFGEMALLSSSPRCCTVTAKTRVHLLRLPKEDFEEIIRSDIRVFQDVEERVEGMAQFNRFKTLQPFSHLPTEKTVALVGKLVEERYLDGQEIVKQGEPGTCYYIIKKGRVRVLKKMMEVFQEEVAMLTDGQAFGEEALLTGDPRNATVQALEDTTVWSLCREEFDAILKASYLEEVYPEDVPPGPSSDSAILDVRTTFEFDDEHVPDAINIPLDEIRQRHRELNPSLQYYVYCLAGLRSRSATFLLNSYGLHARSIKGGIGAWPGELTKADTFGVHVPAKPS